jgi:hypothetical protein
MVTWTWQAQGLHGRLILGWLLCALSLTGVVVYWWRMPHGLLTWDGAGWWLALDGSKQHNGAGVVVARLDLQNQVLLEYVPEEGSSIFLWVAQSSEPRRWKDFRRAVFASKPQELIEAASANNHIKKGAV